MDGNQITDNVYCLLALDIERHGSDLIFRRTGKIVNHHCRIYIIPINNLNNNVQQMLTN